MDRCRAMREGPPGTFGRCDEPEIKGSGWGLCLEHAQQDDPGDCECGRRDCGYCWEDANAPERKVF